MKVFVLAVSIMVLTSLFIGWTGWYVNRGCEELLYILEDFPSEGEMDLKRFEEVYRTFEGRWYRGKRLFDMIVGHNLTDCVSGLFIEMGMRYIGGDIEGYMVSREMLCLQLEKIREGERVTVDTIM